jgi:hypothetical protein
MWKKCIVTPLDHSLLNGNVVLHRQVASFEKDNLVPLVFYYHSGSEIWPDKRGDLWYEWPY